MVFPYFFRFYYFFDIYKKKKDGIHPSIYHHVSLNNHLALPPLQPQSLLLSYRHLLHIVIITVFLHWVSTLWPFCFLFVADWVISSKCQPAELSGPSVETAPKIDLMRSFLWLMNTAVASPYSWPHRAPVTGLQGKIDSTAPREYSRLQWVWDFPWDVCWICVCVLQTWLFW